MGKTWASQEAIGSNALINQCVAESGLPKGTPGGKGLSLDKDLPGSSTFNKPESDSRPFDKAEEGSIYRVDTPDDLAKPGKNPEQDQIRLDSKPTYNAPGGRPKDDTCLTKYPYRDGVRNEKSASEQAQFVWGLWEIRTAHELRVPSESITKVAARPEEILMGLNPKFQERAAGCAVTLKRADIGKLRWIFSVDCGNGPKVVRMKGARVKHITKLSKMDVDMSCSCPAWQWLGPEHHAQREDYLDGKPRGTASVPVIRDPQNINRVCKHVAAVLTFTRGWVIPYKK